MNYCSQSLSIFSGFIWKISEGTELPEFLSDFLILDADFY